MGYFTVGGLALGGLARGSDGVDGQGVGQVDEHEAAAVGNRDVIHRGEFARPAGGLVPESVAPPARGRRADPAILNAANEVAVAAFLDNRLPFLGIARLNDQVLQSLSAGPEGSLADVLAADAEARQLAAHLVRDHRFA